MPFCHRRGSAPRLPNVLVAPQMVHNLLSIRQFTADNSCSIEFDSSGLTVKDSASRRPLLRCDSPGPLYTLRLPASAAPLSASSSSTAFAVTPSSTTWHRRLGHPGRDVLAQLSRSTDVPCTRAPAEHLCHACQLGRHIRLRFSSSSHVCMPLILFTVTCGHLLYSACLVINTIWWWLMIFLLLLDFYFARQV